MRNPARQATFDAEFKRCSLAISVAQAAGVDEAVPMELPVNTNPSARIVGLPL